MHVQQQVLSDAVIQVLSHHDPHCTAAILGMHVYIMLFTMDSGVWTPWLKRSPSALCQVRLHETREFFLEGILTSHLVFLCITSYPSLLRYILTS